MYKKLILLVIAVLTLSGCVKLNEKSYDEIISEVISTKVKSYNTYREGYKFYLPKNMYVSKKSGYNEVIQNNNYVYYLYTDIISYVNDKNNNVNKRKNVFYEKNFGIGNKEGFLRILTKKDKYLVEIIYNYAKIEVMVRKNDLNETVANSLIILSSIKYNNGILKSKSDVNVFNYNEKNVNIFAKKKGGTENTSNFLKYVEEYDNTEEDSKAPDLDLIK